MYRTFKTKVFVLVGALVVAGVAAAMTLLAVSNQADSTPTAKADGSYYGQISKASSDKIQAYELAHPLDLVGLGNLVKAATGKTMIVTTNATGARAVSPAAAQAGLMSVESTSRAGSVHTASVPTNAFAVAFGWIPISGPPRTVLAHGVWNFRDNYVNGSQPDDFSSVQTLRGCSQLYHTRTITYDYRGHQTANAAYLYSSGLSTGAPVSGVRDHSSGYVMNADHGFTDVSLRELGGCGTHQMGGAYSYKHAQDGHSNSFSVSAGWGFLSVSYGGGPSTLQHSTNPSYYTL